MRSEWLELVELSAKQDPAVSGALQDGANEARATTTNDVRAILVTDLVTENELLAVEAQRRALACGGR